VGALGCGPSATGEIMRDLYHGKEPGYDISSFALDRFACAT
jgi:sarcosine oxidase subunit beta